MVFVKKAGVSFAYKTCARSGDQMNMSVAPETAVVHSHSCLSFPLQRRLQRSCGEQTGHTSGTRLEILALPKQIHHVVSPMPINSNLLIM